MLALWAIFSNCQIERHKPTSVPGAPEKNLFLSMDQKVIDWQIGQELLSGPTVHKVLQLLRNSSAAERNLNVLWTQCECNPNTIGKLRHLRDKGVKNRSAAGKYVNCRSGTWTFWKTQNRYVLRIWARIGVLGAPQVGGLLNFCFKNGGISSCQLLEVPTARKNGMGSKELSQFFLTVCPRFSLKKGWISLTNLNGPSQGRFRVEWILMQHPLNSFKTRFRL